MRELSEKDVQQVSGAGVVTDLINGVLDAPARQIGSSIGAFAGDVAVRGVHTATNAVNELYKGVSSFVSGIFGR